MSMEKIKAKNVNKFTILCVLWPTTSNAINSYYNSACVLLTYEVNMADLAYLFFFLLN